MCSYRGRVGRRRFFRYNVDPMTDETCAVCGEAKFSFAMKTCPMCKKRYCERCEFRMGGNVFCSRSCGEMFFFSGEDGDGDE